MAMLAGVPVGAVLVIGARVTARDQAAGVTLDLLDADRAVWATVTVAPDGPWPVTGAASRSPAAVPVTAVRAPFAPGDVVASDRTGEAMVVRDVWATPDGFFWSSTTDRRTGYSTAGWSKAGTATLA